MTDAVPDWTDPAFVASLPPGDLSTPLSKANGAHPPAAKLPESPDVTATPIRAQRRRRRDPDHLAGLSLWFRVMARPAPPWPLRLPEGTVARRLPCWSPEFPHGIALVPDGWDGCADAPDRILWCRHIAYCEPGRDWPSMADAARLVALLQAGQPAGIAFAAPEDEEVAARWIGAGYRQ